MKALGDRGPEGHQLAQLLSAGRLQSALDRLSLPKVKEDALLRARMLIASASWAKAESALPLWQQAWSELLRVPEAERDPVWRELALGPSAYAAYPVYRELAQAHLAALENDFWKAHFLPTAIAAAARHQAWADFEGWIQAFRALPESLTRGHEACAILNLEGLRALDEGRAADAEAAMRQLLEAGQGEQFLSNPDTSSLPKRLRAEGRLLELCEAFDALVKRFDWRLLMK